MDGLWFGLIGVPVALIAGPFMLWRIPVDDSPAATPISSYIADNRAGRIYGLAVGLVALPIGGVAFAPMLGLMAGVTIKLTSGPVPQVSFTQLSLRIHGRGRVRFIPLLEDAMNRQVLRQAGVVYQFRHAELHDYLTAGGDTQFG